MHLLTPEVKLILMLELDPWLLSAETGEPFTHCLHCKLPLVEIDSPWLVNKDFHKGECTLEYAICEGCREQTSEDFSEDSKKAVRNFLENEIPWEEIAFPVVNETLALYFRDRADGGFAVRTGDIVRLGGGMRHYRVSIHGSG